MEKNNKIQTVSRMISKIGIISCIVITFIGIFSISGGFINNNSLTLPDGKPSELVSRVNVPFPKKEDLYNLNTSPEHNVAVAANNAATAAGNAALAAENSIVSNQILLEFSQTISTLVGICLVAMGLVGTLYFSLKLYYLKNE